MLSRFPLAQREEPVSEGLLQFRNVTKDFESGLLPWTRRRMRAVDDVSLDLRAGETLGIVGESGSGKSTLLRIALRLVRPGSGRVLFEGRDLGAFEGGDLRQVRRRMQAVFQDPASSFNPRQSVGQILLAPLEVHGIGTSESRRRQVGDTLELVGLNSTFVDRYPHQLSGGQRQRVAIARAIILRPSLVVADEPTSALDVSVQAQILNLFKQTKRDLGLTYLFVSHNLGVIRYVSDRVAVMRLGRIVEIGSAHDIFTKPQHDYTQALLAAVPDADVARRAAE
jgi:ABC-type glutathione transport system ATPase component